jgi:glutathionylspermidine synthase
MQRIQIKPRVNLQERANDVGFDFHQLDGAVYWDESAYYRFSLDQIERQIEDPTNASLPTTSCCGGCRCRSWAGT